MSTLKVAGARRVMTTKGRRGEGRPATLPLPSPPPPPPPGGSGLPTATAATVPFPITGLPDLPDAVAAAAAPAATAATAAASMQEAAPLHRVLRVSTALAGGGTPPTSSSLHQPAVHSPPRRKAPSSSPTPYRVLLSAAAASGGDGGGGRSPVRRRAAAASSAAQQQQQRRARQREQQQQQPPHASPPSRRTPASAAARRVEADADVPRAFPFLTADVLREAIFPGLDVPGLCACERVCRGFRREVARLDTKAGVVRALAEAGEAAVERGCGVFLMKWDGTMRALGGGGGGGASDTSSGLSPQDVVQTFRAVVAHAEGEVAPLLIGGDGGSGGLAVRAYLRFAADSAGRRMLQRYHTCAAAARRVLGLLGPLLPCFEQLEGVGGGGGDGDGDDAAAMRAVFADAVLPQALAAVAALRAVRGAAEVVDGASVPPCLGGGGGSGRRRSLLGKAEDQSWVAPFVAAQGSHFVLTLSGVFVGCLKRRLHTRVEDALGSIGGGGGGAGVADVADAAAELRARASTAAELAGAWVSRVLDPLLAATEPQQQQPASAALIPAHTRRYLHGHVRTLDHVVYVESNLLLLYAAVDAFWSVADGDGDDAAAAAAACNDYATLVLAPVRTLTLGGCLYSPDDRGRVDQLLGVVRAGVRRCRDLQRQRADLCDMDRSVAECMARPSRVGSLLSGRGRSSCGGGGGEDAPYGVLPL